MNKNTALTFNLAFILSEVYKGAEVCIQVVDYIV